MASESGNKQVTRRKFLGYVVGGISGVIGIAVATPLIGYFLSPVWKKKDPLLTPIAEVSSIPVGEPTYVTYEQRVRDGWYITNLRGGAWVVNKGQDEIIVFDPHCTHLNCPYYWDKAEQIFKCPCHGADFDIDGNVLAGPPPRPLDRLEFDIEEGTIVVTGTILRGGRRLAL